MKKNNPGTSGAPYITPTTRICTVSVRAEILQASGGSSIPDLGETITNPGDAIWS